MVSTFLRNQWCMSSDSDNLVKIIQNLDINANTKRLSKVANDRAFAEAIAA